MDNAKRETHTECLCCHAKIILVQVWGITDNQEGKQGQWNPGNEHLACPACAQAASKLPPFFPAPRTKENQDRWEVKLHSKIEELLITPSSPSSSVRAEEIRQLCKSVYLDGQEPPEGAPWKAFAVGGAPAPPKHPESQLSDDINVVIRHAETGGGDTAGSWRKAVIYGLKLALRLETGAPLATVLQDRRIRD